jgi:CDP-glucose 4,6-dehydratase
MQLEQTFWKDRRVLITGHTGFKGTWLCLWLHALGARVCGYSDAVNTTPAHFLLAEVPELLEADLRGDVRDKSALQTAFNHCNPDVVFHMAAQPLVSIGYTDPTTTFETNFNGTLNLLEIARRQTRPLSLIVVTSDKCYEPSEDGGAFRESDPMGGSDPYSASKGVCELLCSAWRNSYFRSDAHSPVRLASVRAGNVIGGGDWAANRLVPDAARVFAENRSLVLRSPNSVRPWQHVLEPLCGYLMLAERLSGADGQRYAEAWNFGPLPTDAVPVLQVAEWFAEAWGGGRIEVDPQQSIGKETAVLRLAVDKAVSRLHWRPVWNVREAVRRAALWYRDFYRQPAADVRARSLAEIAEFTAAAL